MIDSKIDRYRERKNWKNQTTTESERETNPLMTQLLFSLHFSTSHLWSERANGALYCQFVFYVINCEIKCVSVSQCGFPVIVYHRMGCFFATSSLRCVVVAAQHNYRVIFSLFFHQISAVYHWMHLDRVCRLKIAAKYFTAAKEFVGMGEWHTHMHVHVVRVWICMCGYDKNFYEVPIILFVIGDTVLWNSFSLARSLSHRSFVFGMLVWFCCLMFCHHTFISLFFFFSRLLVLFVRLFEKLRFVFVLLC